MQSSNVLLASDGTAKVSDAGLAQALVTKTHVSASAVWCVAILFRSQSASIAMCVLRTNLLPGSEHGPRANLSMAEALDTSSELPLM